MASSWTCARCTAQNEEASVSCRSCGMIRGGVVTQPNSMTPPPVQMPGVPAPGGYPGAPVPAPGGYPGAPVPPLKPASPKKQVTLGFLGSIGARVVVVVVLVVIGGGVAFFTNASRDSSGAIDKAGDLKPADLKVGDCYDLPGDTGNADASAVIENTHAVKCTDAHHYEVFFRGDMTMSAYPAKSDRQAWVDANCVPAFESYVGTTVDATTLTFYLFYPDDAGWAQGDRGAQCALADGNGAALTGSMKGSKR